MKQTMKAWAAAMAAVAFISAGGSAMANGFDHGVGHAATQTSTLAQYMKEQDKIMSDMMRAMKNAERAGDPAIDFLGGMIPHHEAAIEMSESLLKHGGQNKEIKKIAEDVIELQTAEIAQMKEMVRGLLAAGQFDRAKEAAYVKEYNTLFGHSMPHGAHASAARSVDAAFAEGMILHHELAIDMAKAILEHTDRAAVKELAQNMIDVQLKEIEQMKKLLREMK